MNDFGEDLIKGLEEHETIKELLSDGEETSPDNNTENPTDLEGNHDADSSDSLEQATEGAVDGDTEKDDESVEPSLEDVEDEKSLDEPKDELTDDQEGDKELPKSVSSIDRDSLNAEAQAVYDTFVKDYKSLQGDYTRKTQSVASTNRVLEQYDNEINEMIDAYNSNPEIAKAMGREVKADDIMAESLNTFIRLQSDQEYQRQVYQQLQQVFGESDKQPEGDYEIDEENDSQETIQLKRELEEIKRSLNGLNQKQVEEESQRVFQSEYEQLKRATEDKSYKQEDYDKILDIWEAGEADGVSMIAAAQEYAKQKAKQEEEINKKAEQIAKDLLKSKTSAAPVAAKGGKTAETVKTIDKSDLSFDNVNEYLEQYLSAEE